jgi:hypothetical protein
MWRMYTTKGSQLFQDRCESRVLFLHEEQILTQPRGQIWNPASSQVVQEWRNHNAKGSQSFHDKPKYHVRRADTHVNTSLPSRGEREERSQLKRKFSRSKIEHHWIRFPNARRSDTYTPEMIVENRWKGLWFRWREVRRSEVGKSGIQIDTDTEMKKALETSIIANGFSVSPAMLVAKSPISRNRYWRMVFTQLDWILLRILRNGLFRKPTQAGADFIAELPSCEVCKTKESIWQIAIRANLQLERCKNFDSHKATG